MVLLLLVVLSYELQNDSIGWLSIDKDLGLVKVKRAMDRESPYVTDSNYKVLVVAYDNCKCRMVSLMVSFFSHEPKIYIFLPQRYRPHHRDGHADRQSLR